MELKDYFSDLVNQGDFGNLVVYKSESTSMQKKYDGIRVQKSYSYGMSIELEYNGNWVFGYSSIVTKEEASRLVSKLYKKLMQMPPSKLIPTDSIESNKSNVHLKQEYDPRNIEIEEKIGLVNETYKLLQEIPNASFEIGYNDKTTSWELYNTAGSEIAATECYPTIGVRPIIKVSGRTHTMANKSIGGNADMRSLSEENIKGLVADVRKTVSEIKSIKTIKSNRYNIILDELATSALVHEIFGHTSELNIYRRGDDPSMKLAGRQAYPKMITVIDDPTIPNLGGSFLYDQEGTKSRKKVLIEKGIRKEYINSLETAFKTDAECHGSARSMSFNIRPIPRMSNIYLEGGDYTKEELISDTREGVIVYGNKGGSVDSKLDDFILFPEYGQLIHNGDLAEYVQINSIIGHAYTLPNNIDALSKETKLYTTGCRKSGEYLYVSDGGPMCRIRNVIVNG